MADAERKLTAEQTGLIADQIIKSWLDLGYPPYGVSDLNQYLKFSDKSSVNPDNICIRSDPIHC